MTILWWRGFGMEFGGLVFGGGEEGFVRGGSYAFIGAESFASQSFEFFQAGEFVEIAQPEAHQEFLGGFVEDGAAHDFLAACGGDELFVEQGGDDAGGVDAANVGNFGGGDGLLVSDDGEGFESGHGEAQRRAEGLDETADDIVVLGLGVELVAAGNGADFDAAFVGGVGGDEFVEGGLHDELFFAEGGGELVEGGGLVGGVDDGFESGFAIFVGHG
jgi:hypothetical protein